MEDVRIKICGIKKLQDAICAKDLGAWAVGYIFVQSSKRFIASEEAGFISQNLDGIEKVGVFVNLPIEEIAHTAQISDLSIIQLHGDETPEFCLLVNEKTGLDVIKALRIRSEEDLNQIELYKNRVFAILLDTYSEREYGGTGEIFDWSLALKAKEYGVKIILAGGLSPENIKEAFKTVHPFALDVSSGVEIEKGVKDKVKIEKLFESVK